MAEFLFLAHRIPYPPDRGDKIRSWHMIKRLGELGRVHLGCFADDAADALHLDGLRAAMGASLDEAHVEVRAKGRAGAMLRAFRNGVPLSVALFDSRAMRRFVTDLASRRPLDAILAFSGQMAQFAPADLRARFIMDFVDVDSAKFAAYGAQGGPLAPLYQREGRLLGDYERDVAGRANVSLLVSEAEAAAFRIRTRIVDADIRAVRNGVDLAYFDPEAAIAPAPAPGPIILFSGQMDYRPNVEAVVRFAAKDLPRIRAERPEVRFVVAGRNPPRAVRALAGESVVVTGAVADMRSWLLAADVVVAPLAIARGVQNKVLEAMAMARPVVSSPAAFEGIDAEPGRELIVADPAADAVLSLLRDPIRAARMGSAARARMESHYRWDDALADLPAILGVGGQGEAA